jgi:phosphoribosylglycinamide formyltransferase 1
LSKPPRQPIVILISGRGSNMRALIEHSLSTRAAYSVCSVISDRADAAGLDVARGFGIPARAVTRDKRAEFANGAEVARGAGLAERAELAKEIERARHESALVAAIDECSPALIALAGFMRVLSESFVERYAGKILNIHPSLLPKYAGLHTHRRAIEARDTEHGVTVHFVTAQLDCGPRVIQAKVPVEAGDTEATLSQRVLAQEHVIYPLAADWFCQGRLRCEAGKVLLDGRVLNEPLQLSDIQREKAS